MSVPADLIVHNATVHTLDDAHPNATAFAVAAGRLTAVGGDDILAAHRGPNTVVRDLGGAFVMPGVVDVHNHHALAGKAELFELSFPQDAPLDAVLDAVRTWADGLGPDEWVAGGSWGSTLLGELSTEATLHRLDEAAGGRPVFLTDDSYHNRWVSSRALHLAGLTRDTPNPATGVMVRDAHTDALTGLLLESAALPVEEALNRTRVLTAEQHRRSSARGVAILNSYGVTAFQDAGVSLTIMDALASLDRAGELDAWVVSSLLINDQVLGLTPVGTPLLDAGESYRTEHHRPDFVKIFLDGVPPTRTGAFLEPYLPDAAHGHSHCGSTAMDPDELLGWLLAAAGRGLSAKIHCTGDASTRLVLDTVARVRAAGFTSTRFHVAHGQFVHPDDIARFAELGVDADISPFIWFPGVITEAIAAVLPAERANRMQPNRDLIDSGALVAGGSDWPVSESPNPWEGIHGLVTRTDPSGRSPGTLWPEQAVTLDEAIRIFTVNGATAIGLGAVTGTLTPGKSADFVVLSVNPFLVDPKLLRDTVAQETWCAGRRVFQRDPA